MRRDPNRGNTCPNVDSPSPTTSSSLGEGDTSLKSSKVFRIPCSVKHFRQFFFANGFILVFTGLCNQFLLVGSIEEFRESRGFRILGVASALLSGRFSTGREFRNSDQSAMLNSKTIAHQRVNSDAENQLLRCRLTLKNATPFVFRDSSEIYVITTLNYERNRAPDEGHISSKPEPKRDRQEESAVDGRGKGAENVDYIYNSSRKHLT